MHHKIKCQVSTSHDKFRIKNQQEDLHKTHKIYESKEKLTHISFINLKHVKISQNSQKTYQELMAIFLDFL